MHRQGHRAAATLAAALAALALAASPALAGSDGCDDDGCSAENSPSPVVPVAPQPETIAPTTQPATNAPTTQPASHVSKRGTRTVRIAQRGTTAPQGAVSAGAGGTAPGGSNALLDILGVAAPVLLLGGGGLVATMRRSR